MPEPTQQLLQLSEQQAAITAALNAMNEGRWLAAEYGAASVEALCLALNPTWAGTIAPRKPMYNRPPPPRIRITEMFTDNHYDGRAGLPVVAIVLHTMAGTIASCDAWFQNPDSQVSAHYGVSLRGQVHQYVHLQDGAWANGILESGNEWSSVVGNTHNPNYQTVSIETEDNGSGKTPVTDEQYAAVLAVCRTILDTFPGIRWLFGHDVISPHSRSHCCGDRWWESGKFDALAHGLGLEAVW